MKILGIDLGDGESAVTLLDGSSTVEPRVLPIHGRSSILSAVGIKEGRIVVGDEASVLAGAQDVRVRFKSRYLVDMDASGDVRRFAQGVMNELMREEPALMAQVTRTVVGCPAGWGEGRREQYARLMESAGFPNVSVVPEPRAAFLYARHARGLRIDPALMQTSAMVIDIGSSTTDFAYIVDGHQQDLSLFGDTNLGGGLLDEMILERAVRRSPDRTQLERVMRESPAWKSYCELEARRLKEQYFTSEEKWKTMPLTKQLVVCYDETLMLELSLSGAVIDEIIHAPCAALGARSFVQCLSDALTAAKKVSSACLPQVVILTGGASRMAFFRDACKNAFDQSLMVLCPEPECSIARGLSYAGRVDESLKVFRQEVSSLARGEKLASVVSAHVHELYQPVALALFDAAKESAMDAIHLWRRGGVDTVKDLDAVLEQRIAEAFASPAVAQRLKGDLSAWTGSLLRAMEGELESLCLRCGVPPEKMSLSGTTISAGVSSVKLSLMGAMGMDVFSGVLSVVLGVVGASICGGGGMALIGTGPVGMIAGASMGVLLALVGRGEMEKLLASIKTPVLLRQLVTDGAVSAGIDRQREEIERSIISALADPRNGFCARLCESISATLGSQLERMAKNAEMSICA
ncbi:MAG: Hsp70 family protein [Clostridia bacterium]|nr:Hsp70 family protein [Clostridia bacterium]